LSILNEFESALLHLENGTDKPLADFLRVAFDADHSQEELAPLVARIVEVFADVKVSVRVSFLYFLGHVDPDAAYLLATRDIESAYDNVRLHASYLHQILISIDNLEHFIDHLSAMETEKALRLAYHLIHRPAK
jgi:hypothetical protein